LDPRGSISARRFGPGGSISTSGYGPGVQIYGGPNQLGHLLLWGKTVMSRRRNNISYKTYVYLCKSRSVFDKFPLSVILTLIHQLSVPSCFQLASQCKLNPTLNFVHCSTWRTIAKSKFRRTDSSRMDSSWSAHNIVMPASTSCLVHLKYISTVLKHRKSLYW
jgi:hypothetical protein